MTATVKSGVALTTPLGFPYCIPLAADHHVGRRTLPSAQSSPRRFSAARFNPVCAFRLRVVSTPRGRSRTPTAASSGTSQAVARPAIRMTPRMPIFRKRLHREADIDVDGYLARAT